MISGWCNEEAACAGETLEQREGIMKAVICSRAKGPVDMSNTGRRPSPCGMASGA